MGVLGSRRIVLSLVEKGSCLLSFERFMVESDAVHGDNGGRFFALQEAGRTRWQFLKFADARVSALDDRSRMKLRGQLCHEGLAGAGEVPSPRQDLDPGHVVMVVVN